MGKIAIWILIAVAVMLLLRLIGTAKRGGAADRTASGSGASGRRDSKDAAAERDGELMMSCAVCGIHIPSSDAVFARGKVFCGPEHRDLEAPRPDDEA